MEGYSHISLSHLLACTAVLGPTIKLLHQYCVSALMEDEDEVLEEWT